MITNSDSVILGLKLMYLCLLTFPPSGSLSAILMSHIGLFAPAEPVHGAIGFKTERDIAIHCYFQMIASIRNGDSKNPAPPSLIAIQAVTNGSQASIDTYFVETEFHVADPSGAPRSAIGASGNKETKRSTPASPGGPTAKGALPSTAPRLSTLSPLTGPSKSPASPALSFQQPKRPPPSKRPLPTLPTDLPPPPPEVCSFFTTVLHY
jgi:hypothetical protein